MIKAHKELLKTLKKVAKELNWPQYKTSNGRWATSRIYTWPNTAQVEFDNYVELLSFSPVTHQFNSKATLFQLHIKETTEFVQAFKKCKHWPSDVANEIRIKHEQAKWVVAEELGRRSDKSRTNWIYDYKVKLYKLGLNSNLSDPTTQIKLVAQLWTTSKIGNEGYISHVDVDLDKKTFESKTHGIMIFKNNDQIISEISEMIKEHMTP